MLTLAIAVRAEFTCNAIHRSHSTCACIRTGSILTLLAIRHSYAVGVIIVRRSVCAISTVHLERSTRLMDGVRETSRGST